jgi:hypothetical protein
MSTVACLDGLLGRCLLSDLGLRGTRYLLLVAIVDGRHAA